MHPFWLTRLSTRWNLLTVLLGGCIAIAALPFGGCSRKPAAPADGTVSAGPAGPAGAAGSAGAGGAGGVIATIDSIGTLGSKGKESLQTLLDALDDPKPAVRWHAARSIGLVGEAAVAAIPKLVAALSDTDPIVVTQAAAAMGRIRADDQRPPSAIDAETTKLYASTVEPLADCIVHKDPRVRRAAIRSLQAIHTDQEKLVEIASTLLADEDPSVVFPALHSLADMGEKTVPFLMKSLEHPKARYWATLALAEIGPAAAAAVPKLTALAAKEELDVRLQAIMALAAIGEPASAAVDTLIGITRSTDAEDRVLHPASVYAIGKIRSEKGFAAVEPMLKSENEVLSAAASWARARIHPDDEAVVADAVGRLQKALGSPDATIRQGAVSGLSELVSDLPAGAGRPLAERFVTLFEDPDPDVRRSSAVALVRLGADAVGPVTAALADAKRRAVAFEVLAELGPIAKPALAKLVESRGDANPAVRSDAAFAIAGLGAEAADAVPALLERLEKEAELSATAGDGGDDGIDVEERAARAPLLTVAYALGSIGKAAKPAAETLHRLVDSTDPFAATVAAWAGLKIEPDRKDLYAKAVPLLNKALKSDRDLARLEAATALGDIGLGASDSIALLEMVAEDDPVAAVREAAEQAIVRIRGGR